MPLKSLPSGGVPPRASGCIVMAGNPSSTDAKYVPVGFSGILFFNPLRAKGPAITFGFSIVCIIFSVVLVGFDFYEVGVCKILYYLDRNRWDVIHSDTWG